MRTVAVTLFSLLAILPLPAQTAPADLPLIQPADIAYLGSFALPAGDFGPSRFGYGGKGLCHYHDASSGRDTLFLQGHDWYPGYVAQVEVPALGGTANVLQEFADVTEGRIGALATSTSHVYGMLVYGGRLIVGASCYYDGDGSQVNSHGASGLDLSRTGDFQGFYPVAAVANPRSLGGYMTTVPPDWQALLGGPALTGKGCLSIISNNGAGPCATVFDPADVGVRDPVPGQTLLFYPLEHPLAPVESANDLFNLATHMAGVAFPPGSRSVLFFGRQGTGTYCYGIGSECGDPCDDSHGTHAWPYRHQVWAYDANDLVRVRQGQLACWEVRPYAVWPLEGLGGGDCADMEGAAFDPATGLLYVAESYGEDPHLHVFRITVPSSPVLRDGDVNADGTFDARDTVVLAAVLAGRLTAGTPPCDRPLAADFDENGALESADFVLAGLRLAGVLVAPP